MKQLTTRQTVILIGLFVFVSGTLIVLDSGNRADWLRGPLSTVLRPAVSGSNWFGNSVSTWVTGDPDDTESQLEAVTAERDALLAENAQLRLLEEEVEDLRRQLDFQDAQPEAEMIAATVTGFDPTGLEQILVIDQGSNDGIEQGMPVVSPDYFIGYITAVEPDRSQVRLAIDAAFQVGGRLQNSGAEGIIYGLWQAGGIIEMRHIEPEAEAVEGEMVITSGRTEGIPAGLIVGRVNAVDRDMQADTLTVEILPMVDYSSLQSVTVIISGAIDQEIEPQPGTGNDENEDEGETPDDAPDDDEEPENDEEAPQG